MIIAQIVEELDQQLDVVTPVVAGAVFLPRGLGVGTVSIDSVIEGLAQSYEVFLVEYFSFGAGFERGRGGHRVSPFERR